MDISNNIDIDNPHHFDIPCIDLLNKYLNLILNHLGKKIAEVNVYIADSNEIQEFNNEHRQQDKPTNILSFTFERPIGLPQEIQEHFIGDLAICPLIITREATEQQKSLEAHWAHIFIHGILHLYGYDHITEKDANVMEPIEIEILQQLGFDDPYETTEKE